MYRNIRRTMKRLILISLALIFLVLGASVGISSQAKRAQADTTTPVYGCGGPPFTTLYNGLPIGGGAGYSPIYSAGDYVVSTASQLKLRLASAKSGQIVYVQGTIVLQSTSDMYASDTGFYVPAGVTLAGNRGGSNTSTIQLASGFENGSNNYLVRLNQGSRLVGVNIVGPQEGFTGGNAWTGVYITGNNAEVANCEMHGLGLKGTYTYYCTGAWIHHNYFHHIRGEDVDYACTICTEGGWLSEGSGTLASTLIEGNYFDYMCQSVAAARGQASYTARYNYFGANQDGKTFDCHGNNDNNGGYLQKYNGEYNCPAGVNIQIYNNTSLSVGNSFVQIRGTPRSDGFISVHNNWTYENQNTLYSASSNGQWAPIAQRMYCIPEYGYNAPRDSSGDAWGADPFVRMEEYDDWFGSTPPPSTNVAPVLNTIGNKSIKEGATLAFSVSASDANGDALTYSASNLPTGATFNATTQTFSWTPGYGQSGTYTNVHFQVSDGTLTDSEDITVTANSTLPADINGDGAVNTLDMILLGQHWGATGSPGWIPEDINRDGTVSVLDATLVGQGWTG